MRRMCRKTNQVDIHLDAAFNELDIVDLRAVCIQNQHSRLLDSAFWPRLWFNDLTNQSNVIAVVVYPALEWVK